MRLWYVDYDRIMNSTKASSFLIYAKVYSMPYPKKPSNKRL